MPAIPKRPWPSALLLLVASCLFFAASGLELQAVEVSHCVLFSLFRFEAEAEAEEWQNAL